MSATYAKALVIAACATLLGTTYPLANTSTSDPSQILLLAARRACSEGMHASPAPQAKLISESFVRSRGVKGLKHVWQLSDGNDLRITELRRLDRGGTLLFVDFYQATSATKRAHMRVVMSARCRVLGGRKIAYGFTDGRGEGPLSVARLDSRLSQYGNPIPLNPEVPSGGSRRDCIRVALLDNGVNYLLPEIASALARDEQGKIIGYDFWEEDRRPFDYGIPQTDDPRISPFSPRHHGTMVASIFIREASSAPTCLAAYRYLPSDEQNKIGRIIAEIAKDGIRIVNISSGRHRPWPAFLVAMKQHPDLLFILAAGNNGADLNDRAYYPASYAAENSIVVAATDSTSRLWKRSNWGVGIVDVAVEAVDLSGFDFDGHKKPLTGTSFAAPRVASLAARILAENPTWSATQVKNRINALAEESGIKAEGIPVLTEKMLRQVIP